MMLRQLDIFQVMPFYTFIFDLKYFSNYVTAITLVPVVIIIIIIAMITTETLYGQRGSPLLPVLVLCVF